MKWICFLLSMCVCVSCNCRKELERFLFEERKILYGHCTLNATKYEDAQIYDPAFHYTEPLHTTQETCYFLPDEDGGFIYRLLSLPGTELPEVRYHLYFFLPQPKNWGDKHEYKIDASVSYSHKISPSLSQIEIYQYLTDYKPQNSSGGSVLYDRASGEEIDLVGDLQMRRDSEPNSPMYTFSYSLSGKTKDGVSLMLQGKFRVHK